MGRKPRQATPTTTPPTDAIAALEAATSKANKAIAEAREATREAHEAIQAAKGWNVRMMERVATEFDSRAAEQINKRTDKILAQLGKQLDADIAIVKDTLARWDGEMDDKAAHANDCLDAMQGWLASFAKLADELEREIIASNPTDSYVQGVPDRVFRQARERYRALLLQQTGKERLPTLHVERRASTSSGA